MNISKLSKYFPPPNNRSPKGFTLLELLIVIGILAVLGTIAVIVINPTQLFAQARDARRQTELRNLHRALQMYQVRSSSLSFGDPTLIYLSLPDDASTSCATHTTLPPPPPGFTYRCVSRANLHRVDGNGWIPVNFTNIATGSPLTRLRIAPINIAVSGQFYTYVAGNSWALSSLMTSDRFLREVASQDKGFNPGRFEVGTNLNLIARSEGLVGWWTFDEGSGATARDSSGLNNHGTLINGPTWTTGQVGGALSFDGVDDFVDIPHSVSLNVTAAMTAQIWVKFNNLDYAGSTGRLLGLARKGFPDAATPNSGWWFKFDNRSNRNGFNFTCFGNSVGGFAGGGNNFAESIYNYTFSNFTWYHISFTITPIEANLFINGRQHGPTKIISNLQLSNPQPLRIGNIHSGIISEFSVHNRVLSSAEILAGFNATK